MSSGQCLAASPCVNSFAAFVDHCRLTLRTLVVSLVLSQIDYGNATLGGVPAYLLRRLQSVLNAAARFVAGLPRSAHIKELLTYIGIVLLSASMSSWRQLRIDVSMVLHPVTSLPTFVVLPTFRRVVGYVRLQAAHWTFVLHSLKQLLIVHLQWPPPDSGMNFRAMSL